MVKQEMARVNVNILGISKLTWTGVGEFNSDDHCNALTTNAEEAEVEWFCEDLQDLLELVYTPKRCHFHYRGLECKGRKSRNTWSKRKIWPWSTK